MQRLQGIEKKNLHNASSAASTASAVHHFSLQKWNDNGRLESISSDLLRTYVGGVEFDLVLGHDVAEEFLAADSCHYVLLERSVRLRLRLVNYPIYKDRKVCFWGGGARERESGSKDFYLFT